MPPDTGSDSNFERDLEQLAPQLGTPLTTEQGQRLLAYLSLIQRWNRVYNLTAVRDSAEMFSVHLLDCLAVIAPMRRYLVGQDSARILDVGSGAGLPGVILAILNPGWQVTCIDAVGKKASFIRQVAAELGIPNLHAVHGRVEAAFGQQGSRRVTFDLITSRAFASLKDFTTLTQALLAPGACWAAMKARVTEAERAELPPMIDVFHVEQLEVPDLDATRCLVWMRSRDTSRESAPQP